MPLAVLFSVGTGRELIRDDPGVLRQEAMRRKLVTSVKYGALVVALTVITGCENPYMVQLKNEFGWTEAKMRRDGWLKSYPIADAPVYCYHTLADADCFSRPKPDQKDRRMSPSYDGDF